MPPASPAASGPVAPQSLRPGAVAPPLARPRVPEVTLDPETTAQRAANLQRTHPAYSAADVFWWRQIGVAMVAVAGVSAAAVVWPTATMRGCLLALALPIAALVVLRLAALARYVVVRPRATPVPVEPPGGWPSYSILVPLHDEAAVVPQLVRALASLDYPTARREIIFILEQDDHATRAAFQRVGGIVGARALVLPPAGPRTKPKALTAALACTAGDYVVVYDAEDLPEPDQLKRAVAAFRDGPTDLACLQARLHVHNGADGWFARHFASEYICLFDALLPAYEAARIPIPLGGTSNHFPRAVLAQLGGWDPHNVTEDADLGVRIARAGLTARMLRSVTYEEAPSRAGDWVGQRSRWLKGWMQTWLVHSRYPLRTARQLGPVRWLIFQLLFGGVIAAALFHPLVYALAAWQVATVGPFAWPDASASMLLTIVSAANLAFGWLSAALLILVAGWRHRQRGSLSLALTLPAYWLAMSWAAWIALAELFTAPFHWRKTRHTARSH